MLGSTLKLIKTDDLTSESVNFWGHSITQLIDPNTTTNIDLKVTDDCVINGAIVSIRNPNWGDELNFQVVDKDGIYYPAGTVLGSFLPGKWLCNEDKQEQFNENIVYPAKIYGNLYLRLIFKRNSIVATEIIINYRLHKLLG